VSEKKEGSGGGKADEPGVHHDYGLGENHNNKRKKESDHTRIAVQMLRKKGNKEVSLKKKKNFPKERPNTVRGTLGRDEAAD